MTRILNRQRQLAEQGRLRLGYTVPAKTKDGRDVQRPVRSETWIVTSHSHEHVEHAASLWGGDVEQWEPLGNGARQWRVITQAAAIPAILPPGDPLTQAYEMWSKGGCQRRCDGLTESFSGSPCLCLSQYGDTWYERSARDVCVSKSRLRVLLPDMPGLGSWRMETGSFYATDEIAGMVDTIRGAVGGNVLVPVTLRIEPRTRVANNETKHFVVPVVELRGVTAGALLSGQAVETGVLRSGNLDSHTPAALQAANPYAAPAAELEGITSLDGLRDLWRRMAADGLVGEQAANTPQARDFVDAWKTRAHQLQPPAPDAGPDAEGVYDAEVVDDTPSPAPVSRGGDTGEDPDAVWAEVVLAAGKKGMTTADLEDDFAQRMQGITAADATAPEMRHYLSLLAQEDAA